MTGFRPRPRERTADLYLLLTGFAAMLSQVVLFRELSVAFFGVELIYILALGVWMIWNGAGALLAGRRNAPSPRLSAAAPAALSLVVPASVACIRGLRILFGGIPGAYLPIGHQMAGLTGVLLPTGLLLGTMFQRAARVEIASGGTLGRAYGIESAGGVIGGMAATGLMAAGVSNLILAWLCGLALALGAVGTGRPAGSRGFPAAVVALLFLLLLPFSGAADRAMTRWNHPDLILTRDSPFGRVTIAGTSDHLAGFLNDAAAFETDSVSAEPLIHLAALQCPKPERILIAGGAAEGLIGAALQHAPNRLDYVERAPRLLDIYQKVLPPARRADLTHPAVRLHRTDPRGFLGREGEPFDLIVIGLSDPTSGEGNRFFTREFFRTCARRLSPGGVLALRLPSSENIWSPLLTARNAAVRNALAASFDRVMVLPGEVDILLAGNGGLTDDPQLLSRRFAARRIDARLVSPAFIRYILTNDRFRARAAALDQARVAPNSDLHPVCYRYAVLIWLSQFIPEIIHLTTQPDAEPADDGIAGYLRAGLGWGILLALFALLRRSPARRRTALAFVAGFGAMMLETVILLRYQAHQGALFLNIGLLMTAFMAGMGMGAPAVSALYRRRLKRRPPWFFGLGLILGLVLLNLLSHIGLTAGRPATLPGSALLLLLNGFLTAGLFAHAAWQPGPAPTRAVGPLYAGDLWGGALGAALGSLLLIPFLGMPAALSLTVLLFLAAGVLI